MINEYSSLRDENDLIIKGRTMLYIRDEDVGRGGSIDLYSSGTGMTTECAGRMFIVDDWLIDQLDKVRLYYGRLAVKEGEELVPPVKSDLDLKEEELQRQLADIQRRRAEKANEPPAEVDKTADEHVKDVEDYLRQSTDNS